MPSTSVGNRQTNFHVTSEFMLEHIYLKVLWKRQEIGFMSLQLKAKTWTGDGDSRNRSM